MGTRAHLIAALVLASAAANASGLVGLYEFNNPNNLGLDSSGLGNNLQIVGTGVSSGAGEFGGGINLTDQGGLTTAGGNVPLQFPLGNTSYTISVWFDSPLGSPNNGGFIGWGAYNNSDEVTALRLNGNGFRQYWWGNDLDWTDPLNTIYNVWNNVTVSFDGTTRKTYFNGTLENSDTPAGHNAQSDNFDIGVTNFNEYFHGALDNVAVFNEALTAQQVSTIEGGNFSEFGVTATPEPGTIGLFMGAGLLLAGIRRRK